MGGKRWEQAWDLEVDMQGRGTRSLLRGHGRQSDPKARNEDHLSAATVVSARREGMDKARTGEHRRRERCERKGQSG